MKILCVSDTVPQQMESAANLRRRYSDIDIIISCGDLPSAYLEFLTSVLTVPMFYVRGNHDENYDENPPGGDNLHRRIVTYNGLTFAGLEGSIRYNKGAIQYSDAEMMMMVLQMGPQLRLRRMKYGHGVDIFVAHSPAKGIHDAPDLPHNGFPSFLRFMDWYRPRYMLHGHVHTYDRRNTTRTEYNGTCIMNINPVTVLEVEPLTK
ncbi:MAG: metallophosphoesterase family protein [bacterium]|nr:metallophosphoesterase family protein [bacterium]